VLIAGGDLPGRCVRQVVDECRRAQVPVKVLPSYEEMLSGNLAVQPRPVQIEDLLRREPVRLEMEGIRRWIDDEVVLVTGSAGSIGSEICRQLMRFAPKRLVLVDRWENGQFQIGREMQALQSNVEVQLCIADINDQRRMTALLERWRPDIIFHAAAYKHVPLMEANPGEAIKNTTLATFHLANLAEEHGVRSFVLISTDKAVNPTNVMGACKRMAEMYIQSLAAEANCRFVTVRFGNVLDSAGSVVPIFREQIARGGPVTVTDPRMVRYFMTIPEAAQLVIQAGTMGQGGEIFILDMGEPVRIVDLAADCIRLSGLRVGEDIEIEFTGARPGEKLFEELTVRGERHLPTRHPKIMVAERRHEDRHNIHRLIQRLEYMSEEPSETLILELQQAIPEYQPSPVSPREPAHCAA
jgi:FlaA1/EpsC-like NDP-sugar epimerase